MNKYTIIFDFKGGTYISQIFSDNVDTAIKIWSKNDSYFNEINLSIKDIRILKKEINREEPILLNGLTNVWSVFLIFENHSSLINIIQTV